MEKEISESRTKIILAVILIAFGMIWSLNLLGFSLRFDFFFHPFMMLFSKLGKIVFSWPMILVMAGFIMLAGKRRGGWILVVIGGFFLLPRIFVFPDFSFSLIFPMILVFAGIAMIINRL